jgi:hypothetical protein
VVIDSSDLDAGEVVARIVALVRAADTARGR